MNRKTISKETYNKIKDRLPNEIINMLPDEPVNLLKYATRVKEINIAPSIDSETAEMMKKYLLNDEEYLVTFFYVMAISFYKKSPVPMPKLSIVAAQTGSGKSNLTAKILREDENYVFVDSDKYKHYRFDAINISNNYPLLYPFLTGPDAYDHAENVYEYALNNGYNIIKETAPSSNRGLLGVDTTKLTEKGYKISLNVLAVSGLNSLLSMHERYELQILSGLKTAKLTGLNRHNESYDSLIPNVKELLKNKELKEINIFKRGTIDKNFCPVLIFPNANYKTPIDAIVDERMKDLESTKKDFTTRYSILIKQMNNRHAPKEQYEQLNKIKSRV